MKKIALAVMIGVLSTGCTIKADVHWKTDIVQYKESYEEQHFRLLVTYMRANYKKPLTKQMQAHVHDLVFRSGLTKQCDHSGCTAFYRGAKIKFDPTHIFVDVDGKMMQTDDIDVAIEWIYRR